MGKLRFRVFGRRVPVVAYLPAMLAILIFLLIAGFGAQALHRADRLESTILVQRQLEEARATLEAAVEERLRALDRLAGALSVTPAPDAEAFARLAAADLRSDRSLRMLALLPAEGDPLILPAGDALPRRVTAVLEAFPRPAGQELLKRREDLDLVLWLPVGPGITQGRLVAVLDPEDLLVDAGLRDRSNGLSVALTPLSDGSAMPARYLGRSAVLRNDPVATTVVLPDTAWRLWGVPAAGWSYTGRSLWLLALMTGLSAALVLMRSVRNRRAGLERKRDVRRLREREAELLRVSHRLDLALDAARLGVWSYDVATGEVTWDDRLDHDLALSAITESGGVETWHRALHPDDLSRVQQNLADAIACNGRFRSQFRILRPDGEVRHIRATGAVHHDLDGRQQIAGVSFDNTEDLRRTAELEEKRREAEAASIAKSSFLATMSHEIRTPMNGVLGMLDLLLQSELADEQRARAKVAHDSAEHLLAILNEVLDLSKLDAGCVVLHLAPMDVGELTRSVVALFRARAEERALALDLHVTPGFPRHLSCDATRLRQVLMNLIGNAVKFTDTGRIDVTLSYAEQSQHLHVCVRDTGVGIAAGEIPRMFQRFSQGDSSFTRTRGGTGLGLAISRQLVDFMGGEIGLDSVLGEGSTFRFSILAPACRIEAPELLRPRAPERPAIPCLRILVAEDNATNQKILLAYLAKAGHTVGIVHNGAEALDALREEDFDLVLMDVQMPVMDGLTATRHIRALAGEMARVPIIALTANAMEGDREAYLAAGMDEYVSKPIVIEALHVAIATVLTRQRAARRWPLDGTRATG